MQKNKKPAYKALSLISGGIDSPVASYLMLKKGYTLDFIFFYNKPYASVKEREIVIACVKQLKEEFGWKKKSKLYIIQHGDTLKAVIKNCPRNLQCILCRRMMFRIAEKIAKRNRCSALVTGENLAQVASQTLHNLVVVSSAVKIEILRPLLCYDKTETTKIAEKIGTYQFSKFHKCCGMLPLSPRTKGRVEEALRAEKNLDINKLVKNAMKGRKIVLI